MDSGEVIQLIQKEQGMIISHHFNQPFLTPTDECRAIIKGILELATEEERFEMLWSIVKYNYPTEFKKMVELP